MAIQSGRVAASVFVQGTGDRCAVHQRNGAEHQRGKQRQDHREPDGGPVEANFVKARQVGGLEGDEQVHGAPGDHQASNARGK